MFEYSHEVKCEIAGTLIDSLKWIDVSVTEARNLKAVFHKYSTFPQGECEYNIGLIYSQLSSH